VLGVPGVVLVPPILVVPEPVVLEPVPVVPAPVVPVVVVDPAPVVPVTVVPVPPVPPVVCANAIVPALVNTIAVIAAPLANLAKYIFFILNLY
jgi:hypothetical protein